MTETAQILAREEIALSRFIALLTEEQDALKAALPERLPSLAEHKTHLVDELNHLESARAALIGGSTKLAMTQWLKAHADDRESSSLWERLASLSQQARQLSDLNAKLLDLHLRRTSEALQILTHHTRNSLIYGADGQATALTGSRIIDSA